MTVPPLLGIHVFIVCIPTSSSWSPVFSRRSGSVEEWWAESGSHLSYLHYI